MIVIADSGATKTDWRVVSDSKTIVCFITSGLNPYHVTEHQYSVGLIRNFPSHCSRLDVLEVFFYGAGCATTEKASIAYKGLQEFFPNAHIIVQSDILGAARALFYHQKGIVAILGTGTNVGYYNGLEVLHYSPSLGFILGDEASGANLGKEFFRMWLYGDLPPELAQKFQSKYSYSLASVLHSVYSMPMPARFLAEVVPFIYENRNHSFVKDFLKSSFKQFAERHVTKIPDYRSIEIGFVGSIGTLFEIELKTALAEVGGHLSRVIQYPIENLVDFHLNHS